MDNNEQSLYDFLVDMLDEAAFCDNVSLVKLLLNVKRLRKQHRNSESPLITAIANKSSAVIRLLTNDCFSTLDWDADDVNWSFGSIKLRTKLVGNNSSNGFDSFQGTPLHLAIMKGNIFALKSLLNYKSIGNYL